MERQYESQLRADQARHTKRVILEAALELFLDRGYGATSVRAIAQKAGVSERTVYVVFKDKLSIVTAVADLAFYGETEQGVGQEAFLASLAEVAEPRERLRLVVHNTAVGLERGMASLGRMVAGAAQSDPRLAGFVADLIDYRHRAVRDCMEAVLGRSLSDGEGFKLMIDEIEAATSDEVYWILAVDRGWPREQYEQYVLDMCLVILERHGVTVP